MPEPLVGEPWERTRFLRRLEGWALPYPWTPVTSLVELSRDRRRLVLSLAATSRFRVALEPGDVTMLIKSLRTRTACAVPAAHVDHGELLLCCRPYDFPERYPGPPSWTARPTSEVYRDPVELVLVIPGDELGLVFWQWRYELLVSTVEDGLARLD
jgi:hypothetical protein